MDMSTMPKEQTAPKKTMNQGGQPPGLVYFSFLFYAGDLCLCPTVKIKAAEGTLRSRNIVCAT